MKKIVLLAAVAVSLYSCNKLGEGEYEITGTVKGVKTGLAYLEKEGVMGMPQAIDTVKVVDGKFEIKGKTNEPEICYIQIDKVNGKVPFILEGGEIEITVDKDSIFKSKLAGTYSNEEYSKFNEESYKIQKKLEKKVKAFETKNKALIDQVQTAKDTALAKKLQAEFEPIQKEAQKSFEDFTFGYPKSHPKSFITVLILQRMANDPKYVGQVEGIYNSLDPTLKKTKQAKSVKTTIDGLKKK